MNEKQLRRHCRVWREVARVLETSKGAPYGCITKTDVLRFCGNCRFNKKLK